MATIEVPNSDSAGNAGSAPPSSGPLETAPDVDASAIAPHAPLDVAAQLPPNSLTVDTAPGVPGPPPSSHLDSTFLDRTILHGDKTPDLLDEPFLPDTLPDVASSFVAPLSPLPTIVAEGPDDTYLFDSPRKPSPLSVADKPLASILARQSTASNSGLSASSKVPSTRPSLEQDPDEAPGSKALNLSLSSLLADAPATLRQSKDTSSTRRSQSESTDFAGGHGFRHGKRPRFLRSRNASQRSSTSSFDTSLESHDDVDSDVTIGLGVDYALQSGGAIPALGGGRLASDSLSRAISIGSVASTIGDEGPSDRLGTLSENDNVSSSLTSDDDLLRTPKAKAAIVPPTDTVLTRRVMDIQVPESLAKEYKSKGGLMTPRKPSDFSSAGTALSTTSRRPARNMTLKEQSSTIERLSKENFDLKLKVMFLSDRLDKLSEDGIKEMIQENVEFRTNIAILQRDNKALRRRAKELEKRVREDDERPGTSRSASSLTETGDGQQSAEALEREEELTYLRERVEEFATTIEHLRQESFNKEAEKRRLAEVIKSLQTTTDRNASENLGRQEEEDVWKDLLEQETARREQADDENRRLRDEVFHMKQELYGSSANGTGAGGNLHHTTNIFNVTKRPTGSTTPSRGLLSLSGADMDANGSSTGSSTLIEELRREGEQLRHENAELRKEVGAQTSMLTSRNREKERLYQEIEDLKMAQRRGGPAPSTIDSLLDRSASQIGAHRRSGSHASGGTRAETVVVVDEQEREDLENRNANLRDKINEVKLENQTLLQELESVLQQKEEAEEIALGVQKDYEGAMADLMAMQSERDELIAELNDLEQKYSALQGEFEDLRAEAQEAIDGYEEDADLRDAEMQKLQVDLSDKTENFNALQEEMRKLSEALVGLEDETGNKVHRVQQLEQELGDANKELEELEAKLLDSNDKSQRLLVQQENSQGEIAFLREEQESDKINISRLEVSVTKAEEQLRDEQERVKQLQAQIVTERERSESLATKDKKEMQHFVNELSREASMAKDEARKLRKSLTSREVEAAEWKERLMELENNLREALGDLSGTRSSLLKVSRELFLAVFLPSAYLGHTTNGLKSVAQLQRELENTVRELDATKALVMEKDRIIKQRDALLESHGLETRKVAEALDKERTAHRSTKNQFETFQKTHQHVTRTVSTQDARISELESSKSLDKKRISQLESTFKDQLTERNNLLLLLWTRLSATCGTDWAHDNSLINGRALPSLEVVATMLPGFTKNLMAAIKHIETVVGGFPNRVKGVERDLWREYQTLESNLDARVKKLDRLEAIVRNGLSASTFGNPELQTRLMRIEEAYRQLKVENATLRTANEVRTRAAYASSGGDAGLDADPILLAGSPSPSIPTGPRDRTSKSGTSRTKSSSGRSGVPRPITASSLSSRSLTAGELALHDSGADVGSSSDGYNADPRWVLRLRDLENKLKLEREGRTMDRNEAVRRLREQEAEIARRNERDKRASRGDDAAAP